MPSALSTGVWHILLLLPSDDNISVDQALVIYVPFMLERMFWRSDSCMAGLPPPAPPAPAPPVVAPPPLLPPAALESRNRAEDRGNKTISQLFKGARAQKIGLKSTYLKNLD